MPFGPKGFVPGLIVLAGERVRSPGEVVRVDLDYLPLAHSLPADLPFILYYRRIPPEAIRVLRRQAQMGMVRLRTVRTPRRGVISRPWLAVRCLEAAKPPSHPAAPPPRGEPIPVARYKARVVPEPVPTVPSRNDFLTMDLCKLNRTTREGLPENESLPARLVDFGDCHS